MLWRSGDTVGVGGGVCDLGGVGAAGAGGMGTVDSPRWIGRAPGRTITDGGIISTVIASVGVPSDGSGNTRCPISSASLGASRPDPSKRAMITVMLSGPPSSSRVDEPLARRREIALVPHHFAISSFVTCPESPSLHSTSVSPRRTRLVREIDLDRRLRSERLQNDVAPLALLGLFLGELTGLDQLLHQRLILRDLCATPLRTR